MLRIAILLLVLPASACTAYDDLGVAGASRTGVTPLIGSNETAAAAQITPEQKRATLASLNGKADPNRAAAARAEAAANRAAISSTLSAAARRERSVATAISRTGSPATGTSAEQARREAAARTAAIEAKLKKRLIVD